MKNKVEQGIFKKLTAPTSYKDYMQKEEKNKKVAKRVPDKNISSKPVKARVDSNASLNSGNFSVEQIHRRKAQDPAQTKKKRTV